MINVRNVGEARRLLKVNGMKVLSSKYTDGNSGTIKVDSDIERDAEQLIRGMGL